MQLTTTIIYKLCILYIIFFIFFFLVSNPAFPAWYDGLLQLSMLLIGAALIIMLIKTKVGRGTWFLIFVYHVLFAFLMRSIDVAVYNNPLGAFTADNAFYQYCGEHYANYPISNLFQYLSYNGYNIDDFGYPIIMWIGYHFFGGNGLNAIIFFNGFVIALGSYYLYRLSLNFVSHAYAKLVALLWGTMPFAIYTSSVGLKENFFAFCVICVFYFFYQYVHQKKKNAFVCCIISILSLFLFRLAVGYFAIISIACYYVVKKNLIKRNLKLFLWLLLICSIPLFPIVTKSVLQQRGYEYEVIVEGQDTKTEATGGTVALLTNIVAGFIGPIPNFVAKDPVKHTYITRYSFTPFLKIVISFFFLYAIYIIYRKQDVSVIPFIVFVILNILMMIFTFFTLHDRYHWPAIPLFLIISAWGYHQYIKNRGTNKYLLYLVGISFLIIIFNFR